MSESLKDPSAASGGSPATVPPRRLRQILGIAIGLLALFGIAKCSYDSWRDDVEEEQKKKEQAEERRIERLRMETECEKSKNWFFCTTDENRRRALFSKMEEYCPAVSSSDTKAILGALECRNIFLSAYRKYQRLNQEWSYLFLDENRLEETLSGTRLDRAPPSDME